MYIHIRIHKEVSIHVEFVSESISFYDYNPFLLNIM